MVGQDGRDWVKLIVTKKFIPFKYIVEFFCKGRIAEREKENRYDFLAKVELILTCGPLV